MEDDLLTFEDELLSLHGMSIVHLSDLETADHTEDEDEQRDSPRTELRRDHDE